MRRNPSHSIVLPFGERFAIRHKDVQSHGDWIDRLFPGLNGYEAEQGPGDYFSKTFALNFPHLTVVASAMSSSRVEREGRQYLTLLLPLVGKAGSTVGGKTFDWGAGRAGMLLPDCDGRVIGTGEDRCMLQFRLNAEALEQTARAMRGASARPVNLRLDEARTIPLALHGKPVDALLLHMGKIIDALDCDPDILTLQGHEDWFNRLIVGLLQTEALPEVAPARRSGRPFRAQVVARLCDEMLASLGQKTTLTQLEQKSGYSARALQYAFKERFGCGPLEWLREQRLQQARRRLQSGDYQSITHLAASCGLGAASQFCTAYKQRFGERPGQSTRLLSFTTFLLDEAGSTPEGDNPAK